MLDGIQNKPAILSLVFARFVNSINFFSVSAVYFLISSDLNEPISGLGLISSAFLVGIGLFQIPAGILAARIGPRRTVAVGIFSASLTVMLSGVASNLITIVVLRFFGGVGIAFFFAPGVTLMTRYFRKGAEGLGVGLYNAIGAIGGGTGLFAWALIGEAFGWRFSMLLGGGLGMLSSVMVLLRLPGDTPQLRTPVRFSILKDILMDRWLLLVSTLLLGVSIGNGLVSTFVVFYLQDRFGFEAGTAGAIGSLVLFAGLISAPLAGRFYDRIRNVKLLLVGSGVLVAIGVGVASIPSPVAAILSAILTGLGSGAGFTLSFSEARGAIQISDEYRTIALSWVNGLQLFGGFWAPYLFSYITVGYGFQLAWLTGAIYTFVLVLPILASKRVGGPR